MRQIDFVKLVLSITLVFSLAVPAFACRGNCRPSISSILYNRLVPNKIRPITNTYLNGRYAVGAVRNPRVLLSPCSPVNQYIPGGSLTTSAIYSIPRTNNVQYTNTSNINTAENAYVSSYSTGTVPSDSRTNINPFTMTVNQAPQNSGYFDTNTNSYIWVLE